VKFIGQVFRRVRAGDLRTLQTALRTVLRETRGMDLASRFQSLAAVLALADGNHAGVRQWANRPGIPERRPVSLYYLAHSQFLCGEFDAAEVSLRAFLRTEPAHADAVYLLVDTLLQLARPESAWQELETLMLRSPRLKLWLLMAKLVQTPADFSRLMSNHQRAREAGMAPAWHADTNEYLAVGALRCRDYLRARALMRESYLQVTQGNAPRRKAIGKRASLTVSNAARALSDLHDVMQRAGIEMFLVSGTLLGCIREGRLLGHDKDVDVGIWDDTPRADLLAALRSSGLFRIQASRSDELVRIRHVSGTAIDVFYHYRQPDCYWHGGVKIRWNNRPFSLTSRRFLGRDYLVPEDHDTYLTENYGDWRAEVKEFDSAFDTPNGEIVNHDEMAVYTYRLLIENRYAERTPRYLAYLRAHGDAPFLDALEAERR
jgi:hypothetical protein